jgi:thiol-disulfide isomerase/thioredoxin
MSHLTRAACALVVAVAVGAVGPGALIPGGDAIASAHADVGVGDRAPEPKGAKDTAGKPFKLSSLHGGWVVMTFGGSWCKPCKKELPAWDRLAGKWAGKVTFVAVNLDNDPAKGKKFMDGLKLKNLVRVFAPENSTSAADIYAPPAQPSSYVIDPNGVVRKIHESYYSGDEKKLDKLLTGLVK